MTEHSWPYRMLRMLKLGKSRGGVLNNNAKTLKIAG